jgi:hypothetical protein
MQGAVQMCVRPIFDPAASSRPPSAHSQFFPHTSLPPYFFFIHSARHSQPIPLLFFGGGDESLEDGSKYNPAVISFIRDEYIHSQMQQRCVARAKGLLHNRPTEPRRAMLRRGRSRPRRRQHAAAGCALAS